MSRQLSRWQALALGAVVVVAFIAAGAALFVIGERSGWGSDRFHVVAGFPDVGGVEVGSRVRIQGMDAGEVEAVVVPERPGEPVKLRLRVAGKYRHLVGTDAKVQIVNENLLAGKAVRILPGSAGAKPVSDGAELEPLIQPDLMEGVAQAAGKLNRLLTEVDDAMQAFRKNGQGGSISQDLADATRKLNVVLAKADSTLGSIEKGEGTLGKLVKDDKLYTELTDTLTQVKTALSDVENGKGTLGKLVKSADAYSEAMASLQDVRKMVVSVKQNADAIKSLPVVRSYIIDPHKELVRPDCKRLRKYYSSADLFEPGKAVLTMSGRKLLNGAADWLNGQKEDNSEVVIAAFAEPGPNPDFAQTLTQRQSEIVADYLKSRHSVHRTGWWWWETRTVRTIGVGMMPTPVPETEKLPPSRVEVIVFVPQGG